MKRGWSLAGRLWPCLLMAMSGAAAESPSHVVYGARAAPGEGDPDHRQMLYIAVPRSRTAPVTVRIFDGDTGGELDSAYGRYDTETRFTLHGGPGAYAGPPRTGEPGAGEAALADSGRELANWTVGSDPSVDGRWHTLAVLNPLDGALLGEEWIFRLTVTGLSGNDANVFDVALSDSPGETGAARLFGHELTLRLPLAGQELVLPLRPTGERLTVANFDLSGGAIRFAGPFRDWPLAASGQGRWQVETVTPGIEARERGGALVLSGGREQPNDVSLLATDGEGRQLPLQLPPRMRIPDARPSAGIAVTMLGCRRVLLDAAPSRDPEGEALRYRWVFADGSERSGQRVERRYERVGEERVRLEVRDPVARIGDAALAETRVLIRPPPTVRIQAPERAAPGETFALVGLAGTVAGAGIVQYHWDLGDGTVASGSAVEHAYERPGRYALRLRVRDDSGHPCASAAARALMQVNAAPRAVARAPARVAVGERLTLDAGESTDPDGALTAYRWDLGDGSTASGQRVSHGYAAPGDYTVQLVVTDDSGASNATATTELVVRVNAPPVAEAGADRTVALGETLTLDGGASSDPDGALIEHLWDLGNGHRVSGVTATTRYWEKGEYPVTLTVRDDAGVANDTATDALVISVVDPPNQPPVADPGPARTLNRGEPVWFDASASRDPDGNLIGFHWDFGDGGEASGERRRHTFWQNGSFPVTLTVRDDSGLANDSASATVVVQVVDPPNQPPLAEAGEDRRALVGEVLSFDGAASRDPDGRLVTYRWEFGDGSAPASGPGAIHAYWAPGEYTVNLTVEDDSGLDNARHTDSLMVTVVAPENQPPVAEGGGDREVPVGAPLLLDASASQDPDGAVLAYEWDLGDGASARGIDAIHAYHEAGEYRVRLTVRDNSGRDDGVASDEFTVTVTGPRGSE